MKNLLKEFKEFAMRGNVIDLAVAVVIGAAFTQVINSFVVNILNGFLGAIGGQPNFNDLTLTIGKGTIAYGAFLTSVLNFLIVSAAIFFLVVKPVDKLMKLKKPSEAHPTEEEVTEEIQLLREIRDSLRSKS